MKKEKKNYIPEHSFKMKMPDFSVLFPHALRQQVENTRNTEVRHRMKRDTLNLEHLYEEDIRNGKGFDLDVTVPYNNAVPNLELMVASDSIFSYKFGVRATDPPELQAKRCVCPCGRTESSRTGHICEYCGGKTELTVKIRGWFTLDSYKVFNPDWLHLFLSHINKVATRSKIFEQLFTKKKVTEEKFTVLVLQDKKKLVEFIETYADPEYKDFFLSKIDCAMSSRIPVISKDFRHYTVSIRVDGTPKVNTHPQNKHYIIINDQVRNLNEMSPSATDVKKLHCMKQIQDRWNRLYIENLELLGKGKKSYLRNKVGGQRMANSGRLVVEGIKHYRNDVMTLPFAFFGEVTVDEHRDLYLKHGMTPQAEHRMRNNRPTVSDEKLMLAVLEDLRERHLAYSYAYRAPVIYMGSMECFEIIGLTRELVIRVPEIALMDGFRGDKDGDIIAFFMLGVMIRLTSYFTYHPTRQVYDPVTQLVRGEYELPESIYFIAYKLFDERASKNITSSIIVDYDKLPASIIEKLHK